MLAHASPGASMESAAAFWDELAELIGQMRGEVIRQA